MNVVLLGTSGFHPSELRHTACLFVPELNVMFDAGTGVFRLAEYEPAKHLNIFLTHAHLDHIVGLTYLFDIVPAHQLSEIVIHGVSAKLAAVREYLFAEDLFPVRPPFQFEPLDGPVELSAMARVSYFPLEHPGGCVGYRLDVADRSMAYVTDTTATIDADYLEHIRGVDLLFHEANFLKAYPKLERCTGHSHVQAAAEVAAAAGVGELILVHLDPQLRNDAAIDLAAARRAMANTKIGTDGMEVEF